MQLELIGGEDPAPLVPVSQISSPSRWSYYLIRPPPGWYSGEDLAYLHNVLVRSVAFDRLAVNPPHVSGPAVVVSVGQTTDFTVALWYARTVLDARQEIVALLEGPDTDPVLLSQSTKRGYQALVHDPSLQIPHRLWRCTESGTLEKLAHLWPGVLTLQGTWIPYSPPDARRACRREIHVFHAPTSSEQHGAKEYGRAYGRPQEPQKVGTLSHPTILCCEKPGRCAAATKSAQNSKTRADWLKC